MNLEETAGSLFLPWPHQLIGPAVLHRHTGGDWEGHRLTPLPHQTLQDGVKWRFEILF